MNMVKLNYKLSCGYYEYEKTKHKLSCGYYKYE